MLYFKINNTRAKRPTKIIVNGKAKASAYFITNGRYSAGAKRREILKLGLLLRISQLDNYVEVGGKLDSAGIGILSVLC